MFLVEDGTGLEDANAIISVEFADNYHADRGNSLWAGSTLLKQQTIVRSTDYMEKRWGPKLLGQIEFDIQSLSFPRLCIVDSKGNAITGIPDRWKKACAEYSLIALSESLFFTPSTTDKTGQLIKSYKKVIGPITRETVYQDGMMPSVFKYFPNADALVRPFVSSSRRVIR